MIANRKEKENIALLGEVLKLPCCTSEKCVYAADANQSTSSVLCVK